MYSYILVPGLEALALALASLGPFGGAIASGSFLEKVYEERSTVRRLERLASLVVDGFVTQTILV